MSVKGAVARGVVTSSRPILVAALARSLAGGKLLQVEDHDLDAIA
jgi:hypothetical protein